MVLPATRSEPGRGRLSEQRVVLLLGPLSPEAGSAAAAQLMTLDAEGDEEVALQMASGDGDTVAALMLADVVGLMNAPVTAVAKGMVGGVALAVFAAADRRSASPRAWFRMSEPRLALDGTATELTTGAQEARRQIDQIRRLVADATGKDVSTVTEDLRGGRILDAEEAVAYGLVDEILGGDVSRDDHVRPHKGDPGVA